MPLTRQDMFDKAYLGIAAQGFLRSMKDNGKCLYRGPEGRKCAIGHCMPDEAYDPRVDESGGMLIRRIREDFPKIERLIDAADVHFANELQTVHDHSAGPNAMKRDLHKFAERHKLTIPELPKD